MKYIKLFENRKKPEIDEKTTDVIDYLEMIRDTQKYNL